MNMYIYLFFTQKTQTATFESNKFESKNMYVRNVLSCKWGNDYKLCDLIIGGIVQYCSIIATCNLLLSFPFLACFELLFDAKFDNINLKK